MDKVTFTGSWAANRRIASLSGQDLGRVTLGLDGKSAAAVLDHADLNAAVEALRLGSFRNNGQICTLKTRALASPRRHEELVDRLVGLVESMPLGDPREPVTQIGHWSARGSGALSRDTGRAPARRVPRPWSAAAVLTA